MRRRLRFRGKVAGVRGLEPRSPGSKPGVFTRQTRRQRGARKPRMGGPTGLAPAGSGGGKRSHRGGLCECEDKERDRGDSTAIPQGARRSHRAAQAAECSACRRMSPSSGVTNRRLDFFDLGPGGRRPRTRTAHLRCVRPASSPGRPDAHQATKGTKQQEGIEPSSSGWKPVALPLSYSCRREWRRRDSNPHGLQNLGITPGHPRPWKRASLLSPGASATIRSGVVIAAPALHGFS